MKYTKTKEKWDEKKAFEMFNKEPPWPNEKSRACPLQWKALGPISTWNVKSYGKQIESGNKWKDGIGLKLNHRGKYYGFVDEKGKPHGFGRFINPSNFIFEG